MEYIVIDIETIRGESHEHALAPFMSAVRSRAVSNPLTQARKDEELRAEIMENKVELTPVASRILCIGALEVVDEEKHWNFFMDADESKVLLSFYEYFSPFTSRLITFNGRSFDFPFIMFRAAVHGISIRLPIYPYNGRDNHIDMMLHLNTLSGLEKLNSKLKYISLSRWVDYFGLGQKRSIKDGKIDLLELFEQGRYGEIEEYCRTDVEFIHSLYLKFRYHFPDEYVTSRPYQDF